jgi:phosphatidylserine/phosphatidylglycerophosphate/cardiolipin synthase-like enzyme
MSTVLRPSKCNKLFFTHDQRFLEAREKMLAKYLQEMLDVIRVEEFLPVKVFLESSNLSFCPDFGRKGKEGWLKKCSGGYHQGFSRKAGDYITVWTWRWVVMLDNCIIWTKNPSDTSVYGSLQVDQSFAVSRVGRVITLSTTTRRLLMFASTTRSAEEWELAFRNFYGTSTKIVTQLHDSSFPIRENCRVKVYPYSKDYFQSVAMAMLSAQKEILITSWKNSPTVLLTRPPLPPIRLDQLLKFKADQGVQIYILLYKEVEHIGQGNDSAGAKKKLENLSPNIHVIRHPNKFLGGSTALLWSHHEKLVIIDRSSMYVGGIDLAFQRWDDENHRLADEDGILFPGNDYRQPSPNVFKPARNILEEPSDENYFDNDMVEVEVNQDENLPVALSALADDDQPYEVQVIVDFNEVSNTFANASASAVSVTSNVPSAASLKPHSAHHIPHPAKQLPGSRQMQDDEMSEASVAFEEDRNVATTLEERRALEQSGVNPETSDPHMIVSDSTTSRGSVIQSFTSSIYASRESIHSSISNISEHFRFYSERAQAALQTYVEEVGTKKLVKKSLMWEMRDQYPRMPWHDLQVGISGRTARDAASHFIQRWNHHRLSTSDYSQPILHDITDNTLFTICARCHLDKIIESSTECPRCNYHLGPVNSFSAPESILLQPIPSNRYSFIIFACTYTLEKKLPIRMEGDCPVVVTKVVGQQSYGGLTVKAQAVDEFGRNIDTRAVEDAEANDMEGVLIDINGSEAEWLQAYGLYPARGDVVFAINGVTVTHLNSNQLKRLINRLRRGYSRIGREQGIDESTLQITFRRHYIEGMEPVDKKEDDENYQDETAISISVPKSEKSAGDPPIVGFDFDVNPPTMETLKSEASAPPSMYPTTYGQQQSSGVSASMPSANADEGNNATPSSKDMRKSNATTAGTPTAAITSKLSKKSDPAVFHPICSAAAHREVAISMSQLYHDFRRFCDPVQRLIDEQGTCKVQLLRSVGKWSIGTLNPEISILNAYIESIRQSKHFIYIENQFFISRTAVGDVQNNVVTALVDRIKEAYESRQIFRVIIIIPIHPNGDFCNALKAKCVMHYEFATINRGMTSMFSQLSKLCPGISIADYVGFFSLRNWGVINNKVYSEQIYVHDKLMIVDDRIVIVGSANINDRSMLGARDSEVAVKIEDTLEIETLFNGKVVPVAYFAHTLRLQLMKQHIRDDSIDFSDILRPDVYKLWQTIATRNSSVYDELDGQMSFYRCGTIAEYKAALNSHLPRSILDTDTQCSLSEIQGFLVDWPQQLFHCEDLSPSYATRTMIPNELWV